MPTFVIVPTKEPSVEAIDQAVRALGVPAYRLPRGEWLVKFEGTSTQLAEQVGITTDVKPRPPSAPMGIVLHFSSYWGHAPKDAWEWIDLNQK
jgi:hypothetical protein